MPSRLDTLSPGLSELLERIDRHTRRSAVITACSRAVAASGIPDATLSRGLNLLKSTDQGSDLERTDLVRRLSALQEELDEQYFGLQEPAEAGELSQESFLTKFRQARAVSAVVLGLKGDAPEAIYEAAAAVIESAALIDELRSTLIG